MERRKFARRLGAIRNALALAPRRGDPASPVLSDPQLDAILTLQLATAWAGERNSDEPRLGWWSTDMVSEYGGLDFFARLTPRTAKWAALEVAREAARRIDAAARSRDANPDRLRSLFSFGFDTDEQLADRLAFHKRLGRSPEQALPDLAALLADKWNRDTFAAWVKQWPAAKTANEPSGRRLTSAMPDDPVEIARRLVHALAPFTDSYPCPHVRHA